MKNKLSSAFRAAFPKTIPVLAGYTVLGFGFGLLLQSKGYNFLWAVAMSITIYGGSMQYVAVDLLSSGAGFITTAVMTLLIQARHLFYGISLLTKYKDVGKVKTYLAFGMTDETFSLICADTVPDGTDKASYYFAITLLDQIYWIIGGALGAIFGQIVTVNTAGVEFSMTALFVVIFTEKVREKSTRLPAIIGLAASFVCLLIFGADNFLIPAMIAISFILLAMRKKLSER